MTETSVTALTSSSAGHLFARTNAGVFRSIDYGDSWDDVNVDLSAVMDVRALAVNAAGHLYKSVFTPNGWRTVCIFIASRPANLPRRRN